MRPLRRAVALAGGGAVELPDPPGVEVRRVAADGLVREEPVEDTEASFDKPGRVLIVREVNAVQEVGTIPGVGPDGVREPLSSEPVGDLLRTPESRCMFRIGRRDPARPDRVEVDGQPPAADNIRIRSRRIRPGEAVLYPVRPPGEERRVHIVEGDIHPGHIRECVQHPCPVGKGVKVCEVAALHPAVPEGTEFDDGAFGEEEGEGVGDGSGCVCCSGSIRGNAGAGLCGGAARFGFRPGFCFGSCGFCFNFGFVFVRVFVHSIHLLCPGQRVSTIRSVSVIAAGVSGRSLWWYCYLRGCLLARTSASRFPGGG